jgi:hypothetical protein
MVPPVETGRIQTFPELYPVAGLEHNYCRNPDSDVQAWCIPVNSTNATSSDRAYCNVPFCEVPENPTCGTLALPMRDYRGTINVTKSGIPCQRWDAKEPHAHAHSSELLAYNRLRENYCRSVGGEMYPMCYTQDPNIRWQFCQVPTCESIETNSLMEEFFGSVCYGENCTVKDCGHGV